MMSPGVRGVHREERCPQSPVQAWPSPARLVKNVAPRPFLSREPSGEAVAPRAPLHLWQP